MYLSPDKKQQLEVCFNFCSKFKLARRSWANSSANKKGKNPKDQSQRTPKILVTLIQVLSNSYGNTSVRFSSNLAKDNIYTYYPSIYCLCVLCILPLHRKRTHSNIEDRRTTNKSVHKDTNGLLAIMSPPSFSITMSHQLTLRELHLI